MLANMEVYTSKSFFKIGFYIDLLMHKNNRQTAEFIAFWYLRRFRDRRIYNITLGVRQLQTT